MRKEPQAPPQKVYRRENFQLVPVERLEETEEGALLGAVAVARTVGGGLSRGRTLGRDGGGGLAGRSGGRRSRGLLSRSGGREDKAGEGVGSTAGGNGAAA